MKQYKHLNHDELVKIQTYLECGLKQAEIAIRLNKSESTISRTISAYPAKGPFDAEKAWTDVCERKSRGNSHPKIVSDDLLKKFVLEKIESYWSPEQIAGRWRNDTGETICHETVYNYMYKYHPETIKLYFRRKGKKYRTDRDKQKGKIDGMKMIDERPKSADERKEIGHWEGDTLIGKNHKQAIVTNVERKSGYLLAEKTPQKEAETVADICEEMFSEIPDELKITLTVDQGGEFAWHKVIEAETKMTVYFCHKAAPWQRGTNENTNGLLRQFIPKGTNFENVSDEDLQRYVDLINNRPRKRLAFLTPKEVFSEELRVKTCSSS